MAKRITGATSTPHVPFQENSPNIFAARVINIILDDKSNNDIFRDNGEWASLGTIVFSKLQASNSGSNILLLAKPLFPNRKSYPLKNEIVYIIALPDTNIESSINNKKFYYFQPINIWNSNHHNAIPDPLAGSNLPFSQTQDYIQTSAGAVRRVLDGSTEIELGNTFKERLNIKPTQPYEGDIIEEGRWGQSLRFGSTVKNAKIPNPWSNPNIGENGDPIIILKTGQHADDKDPWIPQVENINTDISSIYLTSTQNIPIEVSSKSYKSYTTQPISPNRFTGEQIILNSGRLLFNSKTDSILFSSKNSINLNAIESLNIDTPKTIIQSNEVKLGDKNAFESIILGDKFFTDFRKLLNQIISLSVALQSPIGTPTPFIPNAAIPVPAVNVAQTAAEMLNKIETYKSKISKTK